MTTIQGKPASEAALTAGQVSLTGLMRHYPDFRMLSLGTVGSQSGQWIMNVTLGWYMLVLTDSALFVGMLRFAAGIPMILASVPSGIILDRLDRRRVLIACQAGMLVVAAILSTLVAIDVATAWILLGSAFVYGGLMALNNAGRQTIVPATVPERALPAAFGLTSAATHASRIVGPSFAGVLIGIFGVASALVFQIAILVVAMIATIRLSESSAGIRRSGPSGAGLLDGFSYVANHPLALHLTVLAAIPMFFAFPYLQLLPVIARDVLEIGPDGLGVMLAMSGIGAITGGLLTERASRIGPLGSFVVLATVGYGGIVLVVAFSTTVWLTVSAIMVGSMTGSMFQSLNNTLFQLQLDDSIRGRATGVYMLGFGTYALGGLPLGYLADRFSPATAIASGAIASSLLATVLYVRSHQLRSLRQENAAN